MFQISSNRYSNSQKPARKNTIMKSTKNPRTILNDQELHEWYEQSPPPVSFKKRMEIAFIKFTSASVGFVFSLLGMYAKGLQNTLDLKVERLELKFADLPSEFDGLRVLFLTDLHLGHVKELTDIIVDKMSGLEYDLCLLGGDYRFCFVYPKRPFFAELEKVISQIKAPMGIYGVLGNHDEVEFVPAFEKMGMKILLNSSVSIQKGGESIYLAGVDEIYCTRRHDLEKAFSAVPKNSFCIFIGHSPDLYNKVEARGAQLYLCGHTHDGQIKLPFIGSLVTHTSAPRKYTGGSWRYKKLAGYTGSGAGTGVHLVRFLCPPEITLITLKRQEG